MARSTFARQNVENTSASETFWKFRCSKMPRRCGEKHICKSKCRKHLSVGDILEVPMFQNATPLWRKAFSSTQNSAPEPFWKFRCSKIARGCGAKHICKSKCGKHHTLGPLFEVHDVQKWHAAVARSTFASQNVQNTCILSQHFARFLTDHGSSDVQKWHAAVARSIICKSKCGKHHTLGTF